ncbi:splicing factor ESS-2 homolog [Ciona intestinalis]
MAEIVGVETSLVVATSSKQPRKKIKKVLDEETYTEKVEEIISRDFFPDHDRLKDEKEYLEAEEKEDFPRMREIALKYATSETRVDTFGTPQPSPSTFETPTHPRPTNPQPSNQTRFSSNNDDGMKVTVDDNHVTLDEFLVKYTSEDNESFERIMDKTDEARRAKHKWLYDAEVRHNEMTNKMLMLDGESPLAITDGTNKRSTVPIQTWKYKNKNHLMYYPEGMTNEDSLFKKPRLIKHENTRFTDHPFKNASDQARLAASESRVVDPERVGHDGRSIVPHESPRVGGYGFVATPSPMPGVTQTPIMTWGEIGGTPTRIDGTPRSTPGPAFRFPDESERDRLTHKMVDDNTKKQRAKKQAALKQMKASVLAARGTPGSIMRSERISSLSPAARRLVNLGTDKALKASYTPTPKRRGGTPLVKTPHIRTPKEGKQGTPKGEITDDLLKIPKKVRKSAADFF